MKVGKCIAKEEGNERGRLNEMANSSSFAK